MGAGMERYIKVLRVSRISAPNEFECAYSCIAKRRIHHDNVEAFEANVDEGESLCSVVGKQPLSGSVSLLCMFGVVLQGGQDQGLSTVPEMHLLTGEVLVVTDQRLLSRFLSQAELCYAHEWYLLFPLGTPPGNR